MAEKKVLVLNPTTGELQQQKSGDTVFGLTPNQSVPDLVSGAVAAEATLRAAADLVEVTARAAADTTLQANINAEITARAAADTTLQSNITAEANARIAADNVEITARTAADLAEVTARAAADTTLQSNINAEITARMAADGDLTTLSTTVRSNLVAAINELEQRAGTGGALQLEVNTIEAAVGLGVDGSLNTSALTGVWKDTEYLTTAATFLDATLALDAALESQASARTAADLLEITARTNADLAEITARTAADNAEASARIAADNAEASLRIAADTTLQANIDAEITARVSAVAAEASARITADNTEATLRANADTTLQANIDAEALLRANADTTLQANINAEITARAAADGDLTTLTTTVRSNLVAAINEVKLLAGSGSSGNADAINTEITARMAADATLQANINAEVTTRAAADTVLTNGLAAEVTARAAADTVLTNGLAAEVTARAAADLAEVTIRANADTTLQANIAAEESARIAADALRVLKAGDSMTGNLAFNGTTLPTGLKAPTDPTDAANKAYVDGLVASGTRWVAPVRNPDLVGISSIDPVTPLASGMYVAYGAGSYPQSWTNADLSTIAVNEFDMMHRAQGGVWQKSGPLQQGTRLLVGVFTNAIDNRVNQNLNGLGINRDDLVEYTGTTGSDPRVPTNWSFPQGRVSNELEHNFNPISFTASTKTFLVAGDVTAEFHLNDNVAYHGGSAPANNGNYTIVSSSYSAPNTSIVVSQTVPNDSTGGSLDTVASYISTVTASTKTFVIPGVDKTRELFVGNQFEYESGTASAGYYTIATVAFSSPNTIVTVVETVAADSVGGDIYPEMRDGVTTLVSNTSDSHYGQSYLYSATANEWVQISGPGVIGAGVGLSYTGTTLNINLGSGITESPNDEVGIDLFDPVNGAIMLTVNGTVRTDPEVTAGKLHLKIAANSGLAQGAAGLTLDLDEALAGESGLVLGSGGLKIGAGLVTNAMLLNSEISMLGQTGTKVTALGGSFSILGDNAQGVRTSIVVNDLVVTVDNATTTTKGVASFAATDFSVTAGVVSLATTGVGAGAYGSATAIPVVTVDAKGRVTALSTVAINTSASTTTVDTATNSAVVGDAVYVSGSGVVSKARADVGSTVKVAGFVTASGSIATSGTVGGLTGLSAGVRYFLSDVTAGAITATPPTSGYIAPVGIAVTSTTLAIQIGMPIEL